MAKESINTELAKTAASDINSSLTSLNIHATQLSTHVKELQVCWHGGDKAKKWYTAISKHHDAILKEMQAAQDVSKYLGILGEGWTKS